MRTLHKADTCAGGTTATVGVGDGQDNSELPKPPDPDRAERHPVRAGLAFGLISLAAMVVIAGWLLSQMHAATAQERQREDLLEAGRSSAVLLTTVDHSEAEAKVDEILASATGAFLEDFRSRSQSFLDTVQRAQSDTTGTVVQAGLESSQGGQADVLVVISVETTLAGTVAPPRLWRMRIGVQQVDSTTKVSDVEFLP